jgi:hypothetical protein
MTGCFTAMREIAAANRSAVSVTTTVETLLRDAGYKGASLRP